MFFTFSVLGNSVVSEGGHAGYAVVVEGLSEDFEVANHDD